MTAGGRTIDPVKVGGRTIDPVKVEIGAFGNVNRPALYDSKSFCKDSVENIPQSFSRLRSNVKALMMLLCLSPQV
jgi:hypothetical protein